MTMHNGKLPDYEIKDGSFDNFAEIHPKTIAHLEAKGITSLFPIQWNSFYPIYNREDVIARDLTGSGKTLAFGLPLVEYLRKNKFLGKSMIQAIVLAPTRELAVQVQNVLCGLKHSEHEFRTLTVYGGVPIDEQIRDLRRGVDIFVGTTGRVLDHIERGNIDFSSIKTIILDEADQMLKLGFKEDIEKVRAIGTNHNRLWELSESNADSQICKFACFQLPFPDGSSRSLKSISRGITESLIWPKTSKTRLPKL
jgi:superfamily II DNA/RNA helicase